MRGWPFPAAMLLLLTSVVAAPVIAQAYHPGDIPYFQDDFALDLRYWWWEGGEPKIDDGELCLDGRGPSILWCRIPFRGKISIEYTARAILGLGGNDRLSDLNFYWMTSHRSKQMDVQQFFESRSAGELDPDGNYRAYRLENGGDDNRVTRLVRFDPDSGRTVLVEYRDRNLLLEPNQDYRYRLLIGYWLLEVYRDDELVLRIDDPNLITPGYFGLASQDSHVHFDNVRVDYLLPDPPSPYPDFFPDQRQETTDPETGSRIVRLTSNPDYHCKHGYYDTNPWSADGSLVYTRAARGRAVGAVYVMDSKGRSRKVADGARFGMHTGANPQWALGGKAVVFASAQHPSGVAMADLVTGRIKNLPLGDLKDGHLDLVSPDGTKVTYFTDRRRLWMIDLTGTAEPRLLLDADDLDRASPAQREVAVRPTHIQHGKWSPDGTKLLVVHTNELPRLWTRSPDLIKDIYILEVLTGEFKRLCSFHGHPIWHPSGTSVFFVGAEGTYLADVTTGEVTWITDRVGGGHPSYRPDGSAIVGDLPGSLMLLNLATHITSKVAPVPSVSGREHLFGTHSHPTWSPDGTAILYDSDQTGACQIYMVYSPPSVPPVAQ
ncbi:DUF6250 domain-containing protein [candidate division KSB1 bacterium]